MIHEAGKPMADFLRLCRASEITEGQRKVFEVEGRLIVVFHAQGGWYAVDDCCTHDGGPLGEGKLEGFTVACPGTRDLRHSRRPGPHHARRPTHRIAPGQGRRRRSPAATGLLQEDGMALPERTVYEPRKAKTQTSAVDLGLMDGIGVEEHNSESNLLVDHDHDHARMSLRPGILSGVKNALEGSGGGGEGGSATWPNAALDAQPDDRRRPRPTGVVLVVVLPLSRERVRARAAARKRPFFATQPNRPHPRPLSKGRGEILGCTPSVPAPVGGGGGGGLQSSGRPTGPFLRPERRSSTTGCDTPPGDGEGARTLALLSTSFERTYTVLRLEGPFVHQHRQAIKPPWFSRSSLQIKAATNRQFHAVLQLAEHGSFTASSSYFLVMRSAQRTDQAVGLAGMLPAPAAVRKSSSVIACTLQPRSSHNNTHSASRSSDSYLGSSHQHCGRCLLAPARPPAGSICK